MRRCPLRSHHVVDVGGDRVGVGADDDLDGGTHLVDAVGARGLEGGFVDKAGGGGRRPKKTESTAAEKDSD